MKRIFYVIGILLIFILIVFLLWCYATPYLADVNKRIIAAKEMLTVLGVFAAIIFFGYKIVAGWLLINLKASMTVNRQRSPDKTEDYLVVKVKLEKGHIDAARLLHIGLRLKPVERENIKPVMDDLTVSRLKIKSDKTTKAYSVDWDNIDDKNKYLNLSPDEVLELDAFYKVPIDVIYEIDLVVIGDRFRERILLSLSQWRARVISLPEKNEYKSG